MNRNKNVFDKKIILIVDDSEINRALLSDMLSNEYEIIEAENGLEASAILHEHEQEISLMLLDIMMPVMDGFETLEIMNKNDWIKDIPVIMISAETVPAYIDRAYELGVQDYINRPFDEQTVRRRVVNTILLFSKSFAYCGITKGRSFPRPFLIESLFFLIFKTQIAPAYKEAA